MSDRRDITDVIRTADAQRRQAPPPGAWARVKASLGPADAKEATGPPATSHRPSRGQLLRDARARPRLRKARSTWALAAAAAVALLVVAFLLTQRAESLPTAATPAPPAEQLELAPRARPRPAVVNRLYDGVDIREGRAGVDELQVCRPC